MSLSEFLIKLTGDERRAIFATLVGMARADGQVQEDEWALLGHVHQEFFDRPLEEETLHEVIGVDEAVPKLSRTQARSFVLGVLYEMIQIDGTQDPAERRFFDECAQKLGLTEQELRDSWASSARTFYERACYALIFRHFQTLRGELRQLRLTLELPGDVNALAERYVRTIASSFEVGVVTE